MAAYVAAGPMAPSAPARLAATSVSHELSRQPASAGKTKPAGSLSSSAASAGTPLPGAWSSRRGSLGAQAALPQAAEGCQSSSCQGCAPLLDRVQAQVILQMVTVQAASQRGGGGLARAAGGVACCRLFSGGNSLFRSYGPQGPKLPLPVPLLLLPLPLVPLLLFRSLLFPAAPVVFVGPEIFPRALRELCVWRREVGAQERLWRTLRAHMAHERIWRASACAAPAHVLYQPMCTPCPRAPLHLSSRRAACLACSAAAFVETECP